MRRMVPIAFFFVVMGLASLASAQNCLVCQEPYFGAPYYECRQSNSGVCTDPCCWADEGDRCPAPSWAYLCLSFAAPKIAKGALLFQQFERHAVNRAPVRLASVQFAAPFMNGLMAKRVFPSCECEGEKKTERHEQEPDVVLKANALRHRTRAAQ